MIEDPSKPRSGKPIWNKYTKPFEVAETTAIRAYVERNGKNKDLESIIAKDAKYSYWYAKFVLNGPFPLGEPTIAKDNHYAKKYTNNVLKKDFILNGKLICKYES